MSRWLVVFTLKRGKLKPPEQLSEEESAMADRSVLEEYRQSLRSEAMSFAVERERQNNRWWKTY